MNRQDQLNVTFGKCFGQCKLNEDDLKALSDAKSKDYEGLNVNQINLIKNWHKHESQRALHQSFYSEFNDDNKLRNDLVKQRAERLDKWET